MTYDVYWIWYEWTIFSSIQIHYWNSHSQYVNQINQQKKNFCHSFLVYLLLVYFLLFVSHFVLLIFIVIHSLWKYYHHFKLYIRIKFTRWRWWWKKNIFEYICVFIFIRICDWSSIFSHRYVITLLFLSYFEKKIKKFIQNFQKDFKIDISYCIKRQKNSSNQISLLISISFQTISMSTRICAWFLIKSYSFICFDNVFNKCHPKLGEF